MSSQSGIKASTELEEYIAHIKISNVRALKIIITDEQLVLADKYEIKSSFQEDFDGAVSKFVEDSKPCYILIRLETKTQHDLHEWLLILYCPMSSSVREKTIFASSQGQLKREFGSDQIVDVMNGIKLSDVNYQAYKDHQTMKTVETPLTMMETFKETLKTQEHNYKGVDAVSQSLPSLKLNLDPKLTEAFTSFNAGEFNYLQSGINLEIENIEMMHLKNVKLEDLEKLGSSDEPRFHFIHYHYEYEGEPKSAKIFVYTVPGFKASIKARMIYSTCRSYLIDYYEKHYSRFDKKLEIDNINEITHESLIDEIHPVTAAPKATFSKPKRPGRV